MRRLILLVPVLVGLSILVFALVHIAPGSPIQNILGISPTAHEVEHLRRELGLNQPLPVQYAIWLWRVVHGNLGMSSSVSEPVFTAIMQRLPTTAALTGASLVVAVVIGIPLGVVSATHQGSWIDQLARFMSVVGISMPVFWLGTLLLIALSLQLRWFPPGGSIQQYGPAALVLPSLTLGASFAGVLVRLTRSSMLDVLGEDYVRTARGKGLKLWEVNYHHALPNAFLPVLTVTGLQTGILLSGAVLTETVFSLPGIGLLMTNAVESRDYPLVMGSVLAVALLFVLVNLVVDVLYAALDPRIRLL